MDIRFIISRMKNASLMEILHRIREAVLIARLRSFVNQKDWPLPVPEVDSRYLANLQMLTLDVHQSADDIAGLLQGKIWSLQTDIDNLTGFEDRVRKVFFTRIKRQTGDPDIRAVWESGRLQNVAVLLLYAHRNSQAGLSGTCNGMARKLVMDWLGKNPFLFGPHYRSVMECGLRMPVFFFALACLALDGKETDKLLSAMYHHAWWIEKRLSLYSSIGNHTVCESVGLVFAGAVFRKSVEGKRWLDKGITLLGQELNHQILSDGGPAEQSLNYHRFVIDLYRLAIDFLESNRLLDCAAWKSRLLMGEEFIAAFQDRDGNIPAIGDSDDGYAVAPLATPRRGAPVGKGHGFITFPDAGYTVIRTQSGVLFTFDHGPLGMAPLYNHGHADALSITISVNGAQMLVDPGTYRYNGVPEYRRYFKGTRAHNTVIIDRLDQAIQETSFIWSKPYKSTLLRASHEKGCFLIEAMHDGYARLKEPVYHKRMVLFVNVDTFLVKDTFTGSGNHEYELNFHLHPDATVQEEDGWMKIRKGSKEISIGLLDNSGFEIVRGQESPCFGWYSPQYGVKMVSSVLTCKKSGQPEDISFMTVVSTGNDRPETKILEDMGWKAWNAYLF